MDYDAFLATKLSYAASVGLPVRALPERLFPFQRQVTRWAIERGRAAIWLDTGLGKTACQLTWAQHVAEQAGDVLILAPLAVSQQTVREGALMGIPVTLCRTQADVRPGINITNYERLHHFDVTRMAGVVLDECFPHDTPIEVLSIDNTLQLKHIADIRIGDVIVNASGVDHVTQIYKRSINRAVRLGIAGRGTIVCSENHPFFTMHGWRSAQDLRPGDYLMETAEAMRLVRRNISTEVCSPEDATLLRSILLSEMAHEYPGAQSQSAYAGGGEKAGPLAVAVAQEQRSKGHEGDGENYRAQSYAESRDAGESVCNIASDEAQTFRAWGQWDWFDGPATDFIGCTWRWLDGGMVFISGPTDSGLSHRLQARLSQSRAQDQYRSRWPIALQQERCGPEAGCQTGFARVDSVEILEQGHPLLEQYRDAEGHIYFYDIKAARHPSFSVDGLLVHNSSILKAFDGKTRTQLIEAFRQTPYRLCCTATPSPNDYMELGNHAEFLGVMSRNEMLATYFTHDGGNTSQWRLKRHAEQLFWRWVASWAFALTHPLLIGDTTPGYDLPPLNRHLHPVTIDTAHTGMMLFPMEVSSLSEQRTAKRAGLEARVQAAIETIQREPDEPWLVWCELNDEADAITKALPGAVQIAGRDSVEDKEKRLVSFCTGETRVLVSKASICGFGLNLQHCARMCFVGINNSFESWYQSVRRCWRFGQTRPVEVHIFYLHIEAPILRNLSRKETEAARMHHLMTQAILEHHQWQVPVQPYEPKGEMVVPTWLTANVERTEYAQRD